MTIHDISLRKLSGSKGQSKPKNTSDNLFSTDVVEVLMGVSEGPIKGLKDGAKSYLIGQTALQDPSGENNFDNFELINYKGSEQGEDIYSRLGGFGASTSVNTQLATDVAVIRTGTHTQIDYLDVRFAINQLVKSNEKGTYEHTGRWKIEYKAESATTWKPVRTNEANPLPPQISGDNFDIFYGDKGSDKTINAAPGDRPTYWATTQPISTANAGIWFNTSNNYQPKVFDGNSWTLPTGLIFANNHWTWTEPSSWGSDKSTKGFVGSKLPTGVTYEQGDYWLHTTKNQAFFYNGSSWVVAGSTLRPGTFGENGTGGSIVIVAGEVALTGKATQVFPKEFRIPVEQIDEPYMLRVTKTSPNNTTELLFDITWESFQEVTAKGYKFPGTAATQLVARASEQFSSIPDFGGIYEGRIVRVPSNYDPVARTYTGVWDGTWKLAYTNNPAYVGNDLVLNDRYGMNAYYPVTLNKWDVYEAGVWCDTRVASGAPRFTFNGLISDPRGGRDALNYIFGIFAGRFFDDGNGTGVIKVDRDEGAAVIFTPENVVDGVFTYSFTEISTRHNDITVAFTNPDLQWQEDRRPVRDEDHIAQYGRIPHNFIAVGCTNAEEAVRRARYHMITGIKETMMVNFKTNRLGLYMSPYDVALISDPDMEFGLSGRVQSIQGARTIKLREPIYLEPGFSHKISFQVISEATGDFVIESRNLTSASGALTQLVTTTDLPALPADCVFTIEQTNGDSAPIAFRVMSISEIDGDPDNVEVQAMQMYRAKWLFIDGEVDTISELDQSLLETKKKPLPIQNLRVSPKKRRVGTRYATTITLDWDKSPTKTVSRYKIEGSRDNGPMSTLADTPLTQFEWDDIPTGEYLFQITAIDVNGYESKPILVEHRLIGDLTVVDDVSELRLVDETAPNKFERRSPSFAWSRNTTETFEEYVVQICTPTGVLIREQFIDAPAYTYEYGINLADNGGVPRRAFTIRVASKDQYGFLSDFEELAVSNPAPTAPATQNLILRKGVPVVKYDPPVERDFLGALVYSSTTQGFTPNAGNLKYKGPNTDIPLDLEEGNTNYVRLAFYDVFGDTNLTFGAEMSIEVPVDQDGEVDITPPGKPTGLVITPGIGFLLAEFVNASDDDIALVEFFINTVNDLNTAKYGGVSNSTSGVIPGLKHGQLYYVWARSADWSGNRSDFTASATGTPLFIDAQAIADAVINADKLATNAVTAGKIAANAVTNEKLADLTISAAKLQDQTIDVSKIVANAVTAAKIAANAVTSVQLAELAVLEANIASGAISNAKIQANAIAAVNILANSITTAKIAANAVTANELAANSVVAGNIAANAITAGKIAANTITGNEIAANTISAKQLIITDWENCIPDGMFENASFTDVWSPSGGPFGGTAGGSAASFWLWSTTQSGQYSLVIDRFDGATGPTMYATQRDFIAVEEGSVLSWETELFSGNGPASATGAYFRIYWYTGSKAAASPTYTDAISNGPIPAAWTVYKGQITVPTGARYAKVRVYNNNTSTTRYAVFDRLVVRKAKGADLIVNGTVTTDKVAANSITTAKIAANAITATELAANSVVAAKIAANAVTASHIAALTITGAEIAANAITAAKIAADAVTADKINVTTLSAVSANAGTVTAGVLRSADSKMLIDLTNKRILMAD